MSKDKPASPAQLSQKSGTTLNGVTKVNHGNGSFSMKSSKSTGKK